MTDRVLPTPGRIVLVLHPDAEMLLPGIVVATKESTQDLGWYAMLTFSEGSADDAIHVVVFQPDPDTPAVVFFNVAQGEGPGMWRWPQTPVAYSTPLAT